MDGGNNYNKTSSTIVIKMAQWTTEVSSVEHKNMLTVFDDGRWSLLNRNGLNLMTLQNNLA
jgi:hypothetical protein